MHTVSQPLMPQEKLGEVGSKTQLLSFTFSNVALGCVALGN